MFRIGYDFKTHRVIGWTHPRAGHCDVVALFAPGYSRIRMASALHKLADEIERAQDPNAAGAPLPTANYHAADEHKELRPIAKAARNVAAVG